VTHACDLLIMHKNLHRLLSFLCPLPNTLLYLFAAKMPVILPVRQYASSVLAVGLCLVTSRSSIKTTERIEVVFGMGASFELSYIHCIVRNFLKIRLLCPELRT